MSKITHKRAMMQIWILALFTLTAPLFAADLKCKKSLAQENPDLFYGLQDQILDLESKHEHLIARLYNFQDDKSSIRPFAPRESIRFHYLKKYGEKWLDKGNALLAELASKKTKRNQLSSDDRELADATLLYTVLEWSFEKADVADEKKRIERLEYQREIVDVEQQIEALRAEAGLVSYEGMRLYADEDYAKFDSELNFALQMRRDANARMQEINTLVTALGQAEVYAWTRLQLNTFAPHINDFWRGLGYTEIPYE